MQPLEYKNIGSEEHLTFDSIRRLVRYELSEQNEGEAKKHIEECERCQGIHQSLTAPHEVRQQYIPKRKFNPFLAGILTVLVLIGLAASVLFFGAESKAPEKIARFNPTSPIENEIIPEDENSAPVIEAIDTLAQVHEEPEVVPDLATNKQFDEYIEKEQTTQTRVKLRGIYGKITANGKPLPGVTVMVPGSRSGRVSDTGGKYYIQVPRGANSLLFIYQGKQLRKPLEADKRRLDINLKLEGLPFPESAASESPTNLEN